MLWVQTNTLQCQKGASSGGPGESPWGETPVHPDLHRLAVFPSAEEPARPDASHLPGFFESLQRRRADVHDAPPEEPSEMSFSGVFEGLDDRQ